MHERLYRREYFAAFNVRFLGYNFLKDIRYKDQPVVPSIFREGKNFNDGAYFDVEKLPGANFNHLIFDPKITPKRKIEIINHVVGQLLEIDKAGIVLFDRAGRNTMVLSWGERRGIVTRQVDLEEFYDKTTRTVFAERTLIDYETYVENQEYYERDLWEESVKLLASDALDILKADDSLRNEYNSLIKYKHASFLGSKKNVKAGLLNVLSADLEQVQAKLAK